MKLTELLRPSGPALADWPAGDPEIVGLSADFREVRPGYLFAALPGARLDGRKFAGDAAVRGAVAILAGPIGSCGALDLAPEFRRHVAIVTDERPHRRLALMAARFYAPAPRVIVAVTGTNGKTSVVHFLREIWTAIGHPAASLGTLGLVTSAGRRPGSLTTPDPVALHRDLAALAADGIEHAAVEASSHGLDQFRLDGLSIAAAAFTNLTRDHLDYHGAMANYRAAKDRLFTALLASGGSAVLNADSTEFLRLAALCRAQGHPVLGYGAAGSAELRLVSCQPRAGGQVLVLDILGLRRELILPLAGAFQAMNVLAAIGLAIATGAAPTAVLDAVAGLTAVPGRLQLIAKHPRGGAIMVDYAHTPDALGTVLSTLRPHAGNRLVALFGCGGDRDAGKRPLMGDAASRLADCVYVTDDNPRHEDPAEIRRAILSAAPGAIEIAGRDRAITLAIAGLAPCDLLVIAGKGHETGQIIGDTVYPFDDAAFARRIVARSTGWRLVQ